MIPENEIYCNEKQELHNSTPCEECFLGNDNNDSGKRGILLRKTSITQFVDVFT